MENKVFINALGLLEINVRGDQTRESVQAMGQSIQELINQLQATNRPVLLLDDLKKMGETDSAARSEVARLAKTLDFDRCAMLGDSNPMTRYGTNLMLRAIGKSNVKFFASRDAALMWLGVETTD
jgi:hypothetical protein